MKRLTASLLLALALCGVAQARSGNDDLDIDKVNGSIRVPDGATAGKLSTVNGGIHVGANAHARSAGTVNGGIDVESGVTIDSLSTVKIGRAHV